MSNNLSATTQCRLRGYIRSITRDSKYFELNNYKFDHKLLYPVFDTLVADYIEQNTPKL